MENIKNFTSVLPHLKLISSITIFPKSYHTARVITAIPVISQIVQRIGLLQLASH